MWKLFHFSICLYRSAGLTLLLERDCIPDKPGVEGSNKEGVHTLLPPLALKTTGSILVTARSYSVSYILSNPHHTPSRVWQQNTSCSESSVSSRSVRYPHSHNPSSWPVILFLKLLPTMLLLQGPISIRIVLSFSPAKTNLLLLLETF